MPPESLTLTDYQGRTAMQEQTPSATAGPRGGARTAYRIALVVLVAVFAVKGVLVLRSTRRGKHRDYIRWHRVAVRALAGEPLADPPGTVYQAGEEGLKFYKLPSAFAVCIAPLGWLPYDAYVVVWYAGSVAAAALAVLLAMKLLHGRCIPADPRALLLPAAGVLAFVLDDVHNGTNNLHLLALLVLGFYLAWRKRPGLGGLSIGLAISWKAFPAAALPVLLLTRRWRLLAWSLVGTAVWTLAVPGAVRGYRRQWTETCAWYQRIIAPYAKGQKKRQWATQGLSKKNQSLHALAHRLCRKVDARSGAAEDYHKYTAAPFFVNLVSLPRGAVNAIFAGLVAAAAAAIGVVCLRGRAPPTRLAAATDLALASTFILIASPIAWTYFFALLLAPMSVGAYLLLGGCESSHLRRICAAAWIGSVPLILGGLSDYARAVGSLTWVGILWFAAMLIVRAALHSKGVTSFSDKKNAQQGH
ncbi:MAG TPA: glycosyltransferase family 87 protein [Phycisphaerae bacterium]|nr:glycosyltransferase family 87 protein [Phycisphaerae bacterium]